MDTNIKEGPKEFFLLLISTVCLWSSFLSIIYIWFQFFDALFLSSLSYIFYSEFRIAISVLLVTFLVFILVSILIYQEYKKFPTKKEGKFKKWLSYFTLFVGSLIIIGSFIVLIYRLLEGEIHKKTLFQGGTLVFLTLFVFSYYLMDLKNRIDERKAKAFLLLSLIIFFSSLFLGFFLTGLPSEVKKYEESRKTADNVEFLCHRIGDYWDTHNELPANLNLLNLWSLEDFSSIKYRIVETPKTPIIELCAYFSRTVAPGYLGKKSSPLEIFKKTIIPGENCFILQLVKNEKYDFYECQLLK